MIKFILFLVLFAPTVYSQEPIRVKDKIYMLKQGDTAVSIAEELTGDRGSWDDILKYNQLNSAADLKHTNHLLIPESMLIKRDRNSPVYKLLTSKTTVGSSNDNQSNFTGLTDQSADVFSEVHEHELESVDLQSQSKSIQYQETENQDMFVGEIRMLGLVSVTRVAIGNGKVIRAEVLKTGELMVIAKSAGSSSLRLWHSDHTQTDYNFRVSEKDLETRFPMQRMVRMKVRMIEFRKSALSELGIDWSTSFDGPSFATAGDIVGNALFRPSNDLATLPNTVKPFSSYFGIASNITSKINFLASAGDAITLAEPVLSCADGGQASFLAGGEIPYPSIDSNGNSRVEFKEYGIRLAIAPKIDPSGNVSASIETEISQVDPAVSVQGAPGLLTRKTETVVNVNSGQTIVISGLLSSEIGRDESGLPGLKKLPVLGALFKSKRFRNSVSELVIFVTPEVVAPNSVSLSEKNQSLYERSEAKVQRSRHILNLME